MREPNAGPISLGVTRNSGSGVPSTLLQIDAPSLHRAFDEAIRSLSPERPADAVAIPALERIGLLCSRGRCSIASEHLAG